MVYWGWATAGPLLVGGLGGGMVTSPNITLTLASVPVRMAGVAGGALQTAQRIGSAIGTASLAGVFYAISVGVPAGVSAVVVSLQPVLTALLATRLLGERPSLRQWLGFALGVAGVALVVAPDLTGSGTGAVPVRGLVASRSVVSVLGSSTNTARAPAAAIVRTRSLGG